MSNGQREPKRTLVGLGNLLGGERVPSFARQSTVTYPEHLDVGQVFADSDSQLGVDDDVMSSTERDISRRVAAGSGRLASEAWGPQLDDEVDTAGATQTLPFLGPNGYVPDQPKFLAIGSELNESDTGPITAAMAVDAPSFELPEGSGTGFDANSVVLPGKVARQVWQDDKSTELLRKSSASKLLPHAVANPSVESSRHRGPDVLRVKLPVPTDVSAVEKYVDDEPPAQIETIDEVVAPIRPKGRFVVRLGAWAASIGVGLCAMVTMWALPDSNGWILAVGTGSLSVLFSHHVCRVRSLGPVFVFLALAAATTLGVAAPPADAQLVIPAIIGGSMFLAMLAVVFRRV